MVYIVEDWETIEACVGDKQAVYQILAIEEEKIEIRVATGRVGFKKVFDDPKDPLINRIIEFCEFEKYDKMEKIVSCEHFFR